ncbi:hypothetical protein [Polaromonas sp. YR568]|uniref:hypothetical protein n=1 Tax=Polaromonas sp. YR568 TaxID=1855301 RepID=UPI00398BCF97
MSDAIYWEEVKLALSPMSGAVAVLGACLAATLTLVEVIPPANAMGVGGDAPRVCKQCRKSAVMQTGLLYASAVVSHRVVLTEPILPLDLKDLF